MVNKVILIGHIGKDPEFRVNPNTSKPVARFSLATSKKWKDKQSNENKSQTQWHNIVLFGRQAEVAQDYLNKGSKVYIEGEIQYRSYKDKSDIEKYITEIIVNNFQIIDSKKVNGPPLITP